jgi:hypothetical protein
LAQLYQQPKDAQEVPLSMKAIMLMLVFPAVAVLKNNSCPH